MRNGFGGEQSLRGATGSKPKGKDKQRRAILGGARVSVGA